jgi:PhnB protein
MPDGRVGHCELRFAGEVIFLASAYDEMGFSSPRSLDGVPGQVYVQVDDVDAHFERARGAGATIAAAPVEEHGTRMYRVVDPEGHRWIFASPAPESGT